MQDFKNNFVIKKDHPVFAGHFPGNPIVPGVVILDHVLNCWQKTHPEQKIISIEQAKFMKPLKPDMTCSINFISTKFENKIEFIVQYHQDIISKGRIVYE